MIQWQNLTKKILSSATAPPYFEIADALFEMAGFDKIEDYPTTEIGSAMRYGEGGSFSLTLNKITIFQWNGIGLALYGSDNNAVGVSLFYIQRDEEDNYVKWFGPKELPAGNEALLSYDYNEAYFDIMRHASQFISFYKEDDYWCGSLGVYSNERFLFTERGNKKDGSIPTDENNATSDGLGDYNISLYHFGDQGVDVSIILSCGENAPVTRPYQNVIKYDDISKPEAFPFLWVTPKTILVEVPKETSEETEGDDPEEIETELVEQETTDYISLPGLYLLSFTKQMAEYYFTEWGTWIYKERRQGKKRLFKMMNDVFFYLNGYTAIIP